WGRRGLREQGRGEVPELVEQVGPPDRDRSHLETALRAALASRLGAGRPLRLPPAALSPAAVAPATDEAGLGAGPPEHGREVVVRVPGEPVRGGEDPRAVA